MVGRNNNTSGTPLSSAQRAADAVERARTGNQIWADRRRALRERSTKSSDSWKRETRTLPRDEARAFAKAFLKKYPKAAYWSEVETWRILDGDLIEFTMRRLPSAD